jgi:hypothetical protein
MQFQPTPPYRTFILTLTAVPVYLGKEYRGSDFSPAVVLAVFGEFTDDARLSRPVLFWCERIDDRLKARIAS